MNALEKLEKWSDMHHYRWMDALRILLGLILHFRGLLFAFQTADLMGILQTNYGMEHAVVLAHILAFLYIFFGTLILIGLGTRFSCAVMVPVVIASIIFIAAHYGGNSASELTLSIVILFLLVFFFIEGSGKFSMSHYMNRSRRGRLRISDHPEKP